MNNATKKQLNLVKIKTTQYEWYLTLLEERKEDSVRFCANLK